MVRQRKKSAKLVITSGILAAGILAPVSWAGEASDRVNSSSWMPVSKKTESPVLKPWPFKPVDRLNTARWSAGKYPATLKKQGYFSVPAYFASQPKPYEPPQVTIRGSATQDSTFDNTGMFASSLPWLGGIGYGGYGLGYGGYSLGYGGYGPGYGGYGLGYGGYGLGYGGYGLGYGGYGLGYGGYGLGYGGYGPGFGGWWGGPAMGALSAGAMSGAWMDAEGIGEVRPEGVIQTGPSKASGNYYAPSTVDPTASGSHYATTTPAITPTFEEPEQPKDYWGSGGDPFPKNLESVPWSR
jgi:hypothetical protein